MPNKTPFPPSVRPLTICAPALPDASTPTHTSSFLDDIRKRCGAPPSVPPGMGSHGGEGGGSREGGSRGVLGNSRVLCVCGFEESGRAWME